MAYVPIHEADVFISYSHADDFAWIERFKTELQNALTRNLRASTKPEIFFDKEDLRAGRVFDQDIPACLKETGFFLAMVSPRYNASTYCIQKELARFLTFKPVSTGRSIQVQMNLSAPLPLPQSLAVPVATNKGVFEPGTVEYKEALRSVFEPIAHELDNLYAQSKIVFLAWPAEESLQKERDQLKFEIEGRKLLTYPIPIAPFADEIRLRDALEACSASVHFLASEPDDFSLKQLAIAIQIGKPVVIASQDKAEKRRGPEGSPDPVWVQQGNPTTAMADQLDKILGRGRRDEKDSKLALGKTKLLLVFKKEVDARLGVSLHQKIVNYGPFEVLEPQGAYENLSAAKAALLCCGKAGGNWVSEELERLSLASANLGFYNIKRAIYLKSVTQAQGIELEEEERLLRGDGELNLFLKELQGAAA